MAINKIPKNYYSDTNIRRDKINELIDVVNDIPAIPTPAAGDAGKFLGVDNSGAWELNNVPFIATISQNHVADISKVVDIINNGGYVIFKYGIRCYTIQSITNSSIKAGSYEIYQEGTDFYLEILFIVINTTTGAVTSLDKYVQVQ